MLSDEFFKGLVTKKLMSEGFNVYEAADGEEALKKTKDEKLDLVLLDILLPNVDGFEVLSKIKNDPDTLSIPVIILSNLGQKEEIEKGLKLGAVDYIIKAQTTSDEISEKVKSVLK